MLTIRKEILSNLIGRNLNGFICTSVKKNANKKAILDCTLLSFDIKICFEEISLKLNSEKTRFYEFDSGKIIHDNYFEIVTDSKVDENIYTINAGVVSKIEVYGRQPDLDFNEVELLLKNKVEYDNIVDEIIVFDTNSVSVCLIFDTFFPYLDLLVYSKKSLSGIEITEKVGYTKHYEL